MRDLINKIIDARLSTVLDKGKVLSVAEDSCKIESLTTGKIYFKCSLNAVLSNAENRLKMKPKQGSTVCFGISGRESFVISFSQVEEIAFDMGTTKLLANDQGFTLESNGENLFTCISDMVAELNKIVVIQGNSIDVAAMLEIQTRINKVLK